MLEGGTAAAVFDVDVGAGLDQRLDGGDVLLAAVAEHDAHDQSGPAHGVDGVELLKIALEAGADARAIAGNYDGTALIAASHLGHAEIVKALIAAKAPLDHVNSMGWTALIMCVVLGNGSKEHIATVEALVKAGANVDIKDRSGRTALEHARARRYEEMVRIMEPASGRKTMLQRGSTL